MTPSSYGWEAFPCPGTLTHIRITWALLPMAPQVLGVTPGSLLCPWCCGHTSRRGAQHYPSFLIRNCLMWHVLPYFCILIQSSLHLLIFKHPYLTHTRSNFRNLKCYGINTSFSLHLLFTFSFEEKILPKTLKRFYGVTNSSRYPFVKNIFYENQDDICFLLDLGP